MEAFQGVCTGSIGGQLVSITELCCTTTRCFLSGVLDGACIQGIGSMVTPGPFDDIPETGEELMKDRVQKVFDNNTISTKREGQVRRLQSYYIIILLLDLVITWWHT